MKWSSVVLLVLLVATAAGFDLKLSDGTVYTDIRLLEKNDGGIRIAHADGAASLNYQKLTPADARTFGFDELKYEAWLKRMTAPRAEAQYTPRPQPVAAVVPVRPTRPSRAYVAPAPAPAPRTSTTTTSGTARGQCSAYTKKGYRCSRMAAAGSSTCWQH